MTCSLLCSMRTLLGFTTAETDKLLDRAGAAAQKAHDLKEMYNGYQVEGVTLYNPFSIISFVKKRFPALTRKDGQSFAVSTG